MTEIDPTGHNRLTGSVASWKTEDLGFEVSGRLTFVIEPDTDIDGDLIGMDRASDTNTVSTTVSANRAAPDGTLATANPARQRALPADQRSTATPLARIDDMRYRLKVNRVEAQIQTAQKKKEATQMEATGVIPANIDAAKARRMFTEQELSRIEPLFKKGVTTQANLDEARANKRAADAEVTQHESSLQAKEAEVLSLEAGIEELRQSLADARRDVADCQLISPFQGQVAAVYVIPGAFVERGQEVLKVQMMDPIKVELQVSAHRTRSLQYKDNVDVHLANADGTDLPREAIIYMIDPTADPATRTFTLTLLMKNKKILAEIPDKMQKPVTRTRDIWRLLKEVSGFPDDTLFVEQHAIHDDAQGSYVWKVVKRRKVATSSGRESTLLEVKQTRVTRGVGQVPFLGLWTFTELSIDDGEQFDTNTDFVAGELVLPPKTTPLKRSSAPMFAT